MPLRGASTLISLLPLWSLHPAHADDWATCKAKMDEGTRALMVLNGKSPECSPKEKVAKVQSQSWKKSPSDLNLYILCYAPPGNNGYAQYKAQIQAAAKHFGINETLFTCLLFRESQFEANQTSKSGARGIAQFMDNTRALVDGIIQSPPLRKDDKQELIEAAKVDNKDGRYARNRLDVDTLSGLWRTYFPLQSKKAAPRSFTEQMVLEPKYSIPAAALYLKYIDIRFKNELIKRGITLGQADEPKYQVTLAGAYNLGHGLAIHRIPSAIKVGTSDISKWHESILNSNAETMGHMISIRNCIADKNYDPMIGTKKKDCTQQGGTK